MSNISRMVEISAVNARNRKVKILIGPGCANGSPAFHIGNLVKVLAQAEVFYFSYEHKVNRRIFLKALVFTVGLP